MIPIHIDTSSLTSDLFMSEEQVRDLVDYSVKQVAAAFARQWEIEAQKALTGTRQEYVRHIVTLDEGYGKGAVMLTGWLPNAIESGITAFDMKNGMLNGPKAKIGSKGQKYNIIPFRVGVPTTIGDSSQFTDTMPEPVHSVVKVQPTQSNNKSSPLKLEQLPTAYQEKEVRQAPKVIPRKWEDYKHKSARYEGVQKITDSVTGQNRYMKFRVVSENSDPDSWIHGGIDAHNLAEAALSNIDIPNEVGLAIDNFLIESGYA